MTKRETKIKIQNIAFVKTCGPFHIIVMRNASGETS